MDESSGGIADTITADPDVTQKQEGHHQQQQPQAQDFGYEDNDFADFAQADAAVNQTVCDEKQVTTRTFSEEDNFADFQNAAFQSHDPPHPPDHEASNILTRSSVLKPPDPHPPPSLPQLSSLSSSGKIDQIVRSAFILNQIAGEPDEAINDSSTTVTQVLAGNT